MLCNSEQLERYWSYLGWGTQTYITNSLPKMRGCFPGQPVPVYHIGGAAVAYLSHSSSPLLLYADSCNSCKVVLGRASDEEEEGAKCALWNAAELVLAGSSVWYTGLDGAGELPFPTKTSVVRSDLEILFPAARWGDPGMNFWLQRETCLHKTSVMLCTLTPRRKLERNAWAEVSCASTPQPSPFGLPCSLGEQKM